MGAKMFKAFLEEAARAVPWMMLGMALAAVGEAIGRAAGWW